MLHFAEPPPQFCILLNPLLNLLHFAEPEPPSQFCILLNPLLNLASC